METGYFGKMLNEAIQTGEPFALIRDGELGHLTQQAQNTSSEYALLFHGESGTGRTQTLPVDFSNFITMKGKNKAEDLDKSLQERLGYKGE